MASFQTERRPLCPSGKVAGGEPAPCSAIARVASAGPSCIDPHPAPSTQPSTDRRRCKVDGAPVEIGDIAYSLSTIRYVPSFLMYAPHLAHHVLVSFQTIAELERWARQCRWGRA